MSRNWRAVAGLFIATMVGVAACTPNAPNGTAGAAQSASVAPSAAESAAMSPTPAASSASPSQAAQPSPGAATTAAAAGTKKPTTGAPPATTAAAGVRVTGVKLEIINPLVSGPCPSSNRVVLQYQVTFSAAGTFPAKVQLHSSDGHDPAPIAFTVTPNMKNGWGSTMSYYAAPDPSNLQRSIDFWIETLAPTRMSSNHVTFTMDCWSIRA